MFSGPVLPLVKPQYFLFLIQEIKLMKVYSSLSSRCEKPFFKWKGLMKILFLALLTQLFC